jgi:hypothetical protein
MFDNKAILGFRPAGRKTLGPVAVLAYKSAASACFVTGL